MLFIAKTASHFFLTWNTSRLEFFYACKITHVVALSVANVSCRKKGTSAMYCNLSNFFIFS